MGGTVENADDTESVTGEMEQAANKDTVNYEVVGSVIDPDAQVPPWVDNIVQVSKNWWFWW